MDEIYNDLRTGSVVLKEKERELDFLNRAKKVKNTSFLKFLKENRFSIIKTIIDEMRSETRTKLDIVKNIVVSFAVIVALATMEMLAISAGIGQMPVMILLAIIIPLKLFAYTLLIKGKINIDKRDIDKEIEEQEEEIKDFKQRHKHHEKFHEKIVTKYNEITGRIDYIPALIFSLNQEREEAVSSFVSEDQLDKAFEAKRTRQKPRDREA